MSGQPYKYAKDVANFRKDYMDALSLRANLDDMNLQANKTYKETGALPPQSQMKDNRLTSEILADTEKLKLSIISDLSEVVNSQMAQLVIQRVQQSPLNADGSFLIWLAQNAPELTVNLKKKYKFGVAGDANDAEQMYLFLQTIYTKTKEMNSSVKSAFDRPFGNTGGLEPGELNEIERKYKEILYRLNSKNLPRGSRMAKLIEEIDKKFMGMNMITGAPRYEELKEIFLNQNQALDDLTRANLTNQGFHEYLEYTDKLPMPAALNALLSQLEKSEKNANPELSIQILENISSILPTVSESEYIYSLIRAIMSSSTYTTIDLKPPTASSLQAGKHQLQPATPAPTPAPTPTTNYLPRAPARFEPETTTTPSTSLIAKRMAERSNLRSAKDMSIPLDNNPYSLTVLEQKYCDSINFDYTDPKIFRPLNMIERLYLRKEYNIPADEEDTLSDKLSKKPGTGFGFKRKRAGRPKGSGLIKPIKERIDKTQGIKQGHTHIQFGKYIINKNKLDDGIFSLKHENGYSVKGHPSTKLNKNLHHVFKTIVGGGQPKYEDLHNLSQEEKTYLHNVSKKAGILDKITIPVPSKDNLEKDIHKFEVMKGEILAGNDSVELIKQFKILLLRLSKNNTISKREASEIFEDLLSLGY